MKCAACMYNQNLSVDAITIANGNALCFIHFVAYQEQQTTNAGQVALSRLSS